jgi:hypothetical protein
MAALCPTSSVSAWLCACVHAGGQCASPLQLEHTRAARAARSSPTSEMTAVAWSSAEETAVPRACRRRSHLRSIPLTDLHASDIHCASSVPTCDVPGTPALPGGGRGRTAGNCGTGCEMSGPMDGLTMSAVHTRSPSRSSTAAGWGGALIMTGTLTNAASAAVAPQSFESWVSGRHRRSPRSRRRQLQAPRASLFPPHRSSLSCMRLFVIQRPNFFSMFVHVTETLCERTAAVLRTASETCCRCFAGRTTRAQTATNVSAPPPPTYCHFCTISHLGLVCRSLPHSELVPKPQERERGVRRHICHRTESAGLYE